MSEVCFHCGEVIPKNISLQVTVLGQTESMCCIGCKAVCETILDQGLVDYYRFRTEKAKKSQTLVPEELSKLTVLDDHSLQQEYVIKRDQLSETLLSIDGINCSACAWLIEGQLLKLAGVAEVNVSATQQRVSITWDDDSINLSQIIARINQIGYQAYPFKQSEIETRLNLQNQQFIRRLGVAGLFSAQVMMFAVCLYFGVFDNIDAELRQYFRWVSLFLASPVVLYAAQPFLFSAIRALRNRTLNMDVPVSIAIYGAFFASLWETLRDSGEVYFESVSMFTFLLLIGRYLEFKAKNKAVVVTNNLLKYTPLSATIVKSADASEESIVVAKTLQPDQLVRVKAGEMIPCDGVIIDGMTSVDESMVSGEQEPIAREVGDKVLAGSLNHDGVITVKVLAELANSTLYDIIRLQQQAENDKPQMLVNADKVARAFVSNLLIIASITAIVWWFVSPDDAFWVTLSVLVATCPCALSLATPTALASASAKLNSAGIYLSRSTALEDLENITDVIFDKTGTLTKGQFTIKAIRTHSDYSQQRCLELATALERHSEHALARAFRKIATDDVVSDVVVLPGKGITGRWQGHDIALGSATFCRSICDTIHDASDPIHLCIDKQQVASFDLQDTLRSGLKSVLTALADRDYTLRVLTGDNSSQVETFTQGLPFDSINKGCSPAQKKTYVETLQREGKSVLMLGDGINDAPVLTCASVSIAMGEATEISKASSDVLLVNSELSNLLVLLDTAAKTRRIIRQNINWAIAYNALILPLAVLGYVTPYIAVIGMSASSLIVVSNSLRLLKK